ncbi:hypothetical protein ATANTOWER_025123 [Ataeniobius toweri]|uniref:Uncharacterized protein n=1 Tax=Ataeniobius toweri TaxID=208326 RepID=A0ABU7C3T2_9TELE|nr:hypothetical protein [Ataeniobius toweri]
MKGQCISAGLGTPRASSRGAKGGVWGEGSLGISAETAAVEDHEYDSTLVLNNLMIFLIVPWLKIQLHNSGKYLSIILLKTFQSNIIVNPVCHFSFFTTTQSPITLLVL